MRAAAALLLLGMVLGARAAEVPPCSYIVEAGDSLAKIGEKFGLTITEVEGANPTIDNAALIQPGDVIRLPCDGSAYEADSVLNLLAARSDMNILFTAVVEGGFADTLADESFVGTVFAPNDTAWELILGKLNLTVADLLEDKELLGTVLKYHVSAEGALQAAELADGQSITTLEGEDLVVFKPRDILRLTTTSGRKVRVEDAPNRDMKAGEALVHQVKNVMWPANAPYDLPEPSAECRYTVESNDTLFTIAQRFGTTTADLIELNPTLEASQGASLSIGMELILFPSCAV